MRATWKGVIPGGIARVERPLWSSVNYPTLDDTTGLSDIMFGNADDEFPDAPYIAHALEAGQTTSFPTAQLAEGDVSRFTADGPLTLASEAQLSIDVEGSSDGIDVGFQFASALYPSGLVEHAVYAVVEPSAGAALSIGFADPRLRQVFTENLGTATVDVVQFGPLNRQGAQVLAQQGNIDSTQVKGRGPATGYARGEALLLRAGQEVLARIPITYFIEE